MTVLLRRASAIALLGLLIGCVDTGDEQLGAHDPTAQMRPELIELSATSANPGQTIEVRFPQQTDRGVAWALEAQDGNNWRVLYYLTAALSNSEGSPSWWAVEDGEGNGWEDLGVSGPGPDALSIPTSVQPGAYRLCTANSVENICTTLDIEE